MTAWPTTSLGQVFDIARGGSPRPIDAFLTDSADGINWISIGDASDGSKYITKTRRKIKAEGVARSRKVFPGDFLLTNSMSFGRPYIMATEGCIHDGWLVLSPKKNNVDPDYFYQMLGSEETYAKFAKLASGATVKNLNIELVEGVEIKFPPLTEQRRIAAILDQADALRARRRAALAQLDEMAQAIFVEMFLSQAPGDDPWPLVRVESIGKSFRSGPFGSQLLHSEFVDAGIAVLGIDNAVRNEFAWDQRRFITPEKFQQLARYRVYPGDVIVTIMGTCGRAAIVPEGIGPAITTKHLCSITLDPAACSPAYLHASLLSHPDVLRQLGVSAKGAVMPGLNIGLIKALELPLPPIAWQNEFGRRQAKLHESRADMVRSAAELDSLFASLQHRAFRGEL